MKTQNMSKFLRLISPEAKKPSQIISPEQQPIKHEDQTASPIGKEEMQMLLGSQ